MNNTIVKPSELQPKNTLAMLIYGQSGVGKSTLACSAPNAVLIDTDGGVQRIHGAHQVPTQQVSCWGDVRNAINMIRSGEFFCDTVIFDTTGKLLDYMSADIIARNPKMGQRDGSLSLKGYGERKVMFSNLVKEMMVMGKNVVFVAHEREEKQGENTYKRPEIGGSSAGDLIRELDLVGYMYAYGPDRVISFDPNEFFYAKNCCNLQPNIKVPVVIDRATGEPTGNNDFLTQVISTFQKWQMAQRNTRKAYEELIESFRDAINGAESVDDINGLLATIGSAQHIWNSKMMAGQMLNGKARSIGARYDSVKKVYVTAA